MFLQYVLVPNTVPSSDVLSSGVCRGVLEIPGCDTVSLFILSAEFDNDHPKWFYDENVVLSISSNTLMSSKLLDTVAIAAALDGKRMSRKTPRAFTDSVIAE